MARPALLALHGFMATSATWEPLARELPGWELCFPYIAPTTARKASFDALAARIEEQVRAMSSAPLLLGYSMGGRIALEYLQRYESAPIRALIVESAGLGPEDSSEREQYRARAQAWAERFLSEKPAEYVAWWESLDVLAAPPEVQEALRPMRLSCEPATLASLTLATGQHTMHSASENRALLARRGATYIAGSGDERYSALARSLEGTGVHVHLFEAGHNVHQRQPARMAALLTRVWEESERAGGL